MDKKNIEAIQEEWKLVAESHTEAEKAQIEALEERMQIVTRITGHTLTELTNQLWHIMDSADLIHLVDIPLYYYTGKSPSLSGLVSVASIVAVDGFVGCRLFGKHSEPDVSEIMKELRDKRTKTEACKRITEQIRMTNNLLLRLERKITPMATGIASIISVSGTDLDRYPAHQKEAINTALKVANTLVTVIKTPILTAENELSAEVAKLPEIVYPVLDM